MKRIIERNPCRGVLFRIGNNSLNTCGIKLIHLKKFVSFISRHFCIFSFSWCYYFFFFFVELNSNGFVQELYIHIGWPLYRKYGHAFEVGIFFLFFNGSLIVVVTE